LFSFAPRTWPEKAFNALKEDRTMQLLCILSMVVALAPPAPAQATAQDKPKAASAATKKAGAARTVEITGGDDMKFNVTKIDAKPGETIRIVLKSVGTLPKIAMAHNVVVLKADADQIKFTQAGMTARDTDFIAPALKSQVLAATALAGPGETVEVTFKAPAKAGSYPYVCTFPGHFAAGMKGQLVVK
jgi:azurin